MKLECSKPDVSEYDFFKILASSIVLSGENIVIEKNQLQKRLYSFCKRQEYCSLFNNIPKCDDYSLENAYVDLSCSFQKACTLKILLNLDDCYSKSKFLVDMTDEEAEKIQFGYDQKVVALINKLCNELFNQKRGVRVLKKVTY